MMGSRIIIRVGWSLLILVIGLTPFFVKNIKSVDKSITFKNYREGVEGKTGTLRETYENRQITLAYDSISTRSSEILIKPARITFEDQSGKWFIEGSSAIRRSDEWTIFGPIKLSFRNLNDALIGEGLAQGDIPCLIWSRGVWKGLVPVKWTSLSGLFQGQWALPAGWVRRSSGVFESQLAPITFLARDNNKNSLKSLKADAVITTPNLDEILLMQIQSNLLSGQLTTSKAAVTNGEISFPTKVSFIRKNELILNSDNALYSESESSSKLGLSNVRGSKLEANAAESIRSESAFIFPDLSRFIGNVEFNRSEGSNRTIIRSPDIFMRERQGASYPTDIQPDEVFSPQSTEIILNDLKFISQTLRFNRRSLTWSLGPTVRGEGKDGTYLGGAASGNRDLWTIQGPVKYELNNNEGVLSGTLLRGSKLQWTLSGDPIIWRRDSDTITTSKIIKNTSLIKFPEPLRGTFLEQKGRITVDAASGSYENNRMLLGGPIVLNGLGWSCNARGASIVFDQSRKISVIRLEGEVVLRGKLGEGSGDRLEITPNPKDKTYTIYWQGRVRGSNKIYD